MHVETLARWAALGFLTALAAVVLFKVLLGKISLRGLLTGERRDGTEYFSLGRTQLLICSIVILVNYIRQFLANPSRVSLPDVPAVALGTIIGSQLIYLAGKARALWFDPSDSTSSKGSM